MATLDPAAATSNNDHQQTHIDLSDGDAPARSGASAARSCDAMGVKSEESVEEDGEAEHDYDDSASFLEDILNADSDDESPLTDAVDRCTPEESLAYRKRLHEVGMDAFVRETLSVGNITAKKLCTAFNVPIPLFWEGSDDSRYFRVLGMAMLRELHTRQKLPEYNTINDAAKLLQHSQKIIVITGAGISTSLGIPDFRSKGTGFYDKMRAKGFESGEDVFDIDTFNFDPKIFYDNAGDTLPHSDITSPTHAFIKLLQDKGKLLTNYTQNIDNIEGNAGIKSEHLIQCHGSWATATCRKCNFKQPGSEIFDDVKAHRVPQCPKCIVSLQAAPVASLKRKRSSHSNRSSKSRKHDFEDDSSDEDGKYDIPQPGVMKPDITFFGEALPPTFFERFKEKDRHEVDLVIVIGTSMNVAPVSEIPAALEPKVPHIYISRTECKHINFDVTLLGDCDVVVAELAKRANWHLEHSMLPKTREAVVSAVRSEDGIWSVQRPEQLVEPKAESPKLIS